MARSGDCIKQLTTEFENAHAYECDVEDSNSIQNTFYQIKHDLGEIDIIVYNAGSGSWGNIEEINPEDFESNWRVNGNVTNLAKCPKSFWELGCKNIYFLN